MKNFKFPTASTLLFAVVVFSATLLLKTEQGDAQQGREIAVENGGTAQGDQSPPGPAADATQEVVKALKEFGYLDKPSDGWDKSAKEAARMFLSDSPGSDPIALADPALKAMRVLIQQTRDRMRPDFFDLSVAKGISFELGAQLTSDDALLVAANKGGAIIWEMESLRPVYQIPSRISAFDIAPDGKTLAFATSGNSLRLFDLRAGRLIRAFVFADTPDQLTKINPRVMKFSPKGDAIVIGDGIGRIIVQPTLGGAWRQISPAVTTKSYSEASKWEIAALDVSRDGRLAASIAAFDGELKIWDIEKGQLVRSIKVYPGAEAGKDKESLSTYDPLRTQLAFDASGRTVTIAAKLNYRAPSEGNSIYRVDLQTGTISAVYPGGRISTIKFNSKRDRLAIGLEAPKVTANEGDRPEKKRQATSGPEIITSDTVKVFDVDTGAVAETIPDQSAISAVGQSANFVLASRKNGEISGYAWLNLRTQEQRFLLQQSVKRLSDIASADMQKIYIGSYSDKLLAINGTSGEISPQPLVGDGVTIAKKSATKEVFDGQMEWLDISGDGKLVDVKSADVESMRAAVTSARESTDEYKVDPASGRVTVLKPLDWGSFSPGVRRSIDPDSGEMSVQYFTPPPALPDGYKHRRTVRSLDGTRVATTYARDQKGADSTAFVSIVDVLAGREISRIQMDPVSHDPLVYINGKKGECRFSECLRTLGVTDLDYSTPPLSISGTGRRVLGGYLEPHIVSYDIQSGRKIATYDTTLEFEKFFPGAITGPNVDPRIGWPTRSIETTGRYLSMPNRIIPVPGSEDFYVALGKNIGARQEHMLRFNGATGAVMQDIPISVRPTADAVSSDGRMLALGDVWGTIELFDAGSGQKLGDLRGHTTFVRRILFSKNNDRIISSGDDGTVRIWSAKERQLLATTYLFGGDEWLTMTPEGFFVASPNGASSVLLRTGPTKNITIAQVYEALFRPDLVREKLSGDARGVVRAAASQLSLPRVLASGPAPFLKYTNELSKNSTSDKISLGIELTNRGGGFGRIEWRINGVTIGVDQPSPDVATSRLNKEISLEVGENEIEVVAYNKENLIATKSERVVVNFDAPANAIAPRLFLVALGVNQYAEQSIRLSFAVPDAEALAAAFQTAAQKVYSSVDVTVVKDTDVQRSKLNDIFEKLSRDIRPTDTFVFSIAGHGKTVDGRYYFIPQDYKAGDLSAIVRQGISQEEWQNWFSKISARKSLLLFDTCESGTLTSAVEDTAALERRSASDRLARATGRSVFAASSGDQEALEGYQGHGLFTYNLIEALKLSDSDRNGKVDLLELATYVYARTTALSERVFKHRQAPQISLAGPNYALGAANVIASVSQDENAKPTHTLKNETDLVVLPAFGSRRVRKLAAPLSVSVVQNEGSWSLIASDGKLLGFVLSQNLSPI